MAMMGSNVTWSGTSNGTLPQAMVSMMETTLSGAASGTSSFATVMQSMLDSMDDLMGGWPGTGVATPLQTMTGTMEQVLAGLSTGTSPSTLMQSMLTAMQGTLSNGGFTMGGMMGGWSTVTSGATTAGVGPAMLSSGGHTLSVSVDRAHLTVQPNGNSVIVTEMGTGAAPVGMAGGMNQIVATDGQIMTGLNDQVAGPVWRMYEAALGRQPDAPGFSAWMGAMQNGLGVTQMADSFMGSGEFQSRYGAMTDNQFVTQLYHNVLGRDPDQAGLQAWTDAMAHGMARDTVLVGFAQSPENISLTAPHAGPAGYWLM